MVLCLIDDDSDRLDPVKVSKQEGPSHLQDGCHPAGQRIHRELAVFGFDYDVHPSDGQALEAERCRQDIAEKHGEAGEIPSKLRLCLDHLIANPVYGPRHARLLHPEVGALAVPLRVTPERAIHGFTNRFALAVAMPPRARLVRDGGHGLGHETRSVTRKKRASVWPSPSVTCLADDLIARSVGSYPRHDV